MSNDEMRRGISALLRRDFHFFTDLGFDVVDDSTDAMTWRRGDRTLHVSRDWRDGFLDMGFGLEPQGDRMWFGLRHALVITGQAEKWPRHGWHAWESSTVEAYISELADLVEQHLADFLSGDEESWRAANALAQTEAHEHTAEIAARQLRSRAEAARASRDWTRVVESYEELRQHGVALTEAEDARLQYALRQTPGQ